MDAPDPAGPPGLSGPQIAGGRPGCGRQHPAARCAAPPPGTGFAAAGPAPAGMAAPERTAPRHGPPDDARGAPGGGTDAGPQPRQKSGSIRPAQDRTSGGSRPETAGRAAVLAGCGGAFCAGTACRRAGRPHGRTLCAGPGPDPQGPALPGASSTVQQSKRRKGRASIPSTRPRAILQLPGCERGRRDGASRYFCKGTGAGMACGKHAGFAVPCIARTGISQSYAGFRAAREGIPWVGAGRRAARAGSRPRCSDPGFACGKYAGPGTDAGTSDLPRERGGNRRRSPGRS